MAEFENTEANRILIHNDVGPVHEMNNNLGDDNLSRQSSGITGGMNLKDNTLEAVKVGLNKDDSVAHF